MINVCFIILVIVGVVITFVISHFIQFNNIREYKRARKEIRPGAIYHVCTNYWSSSDNPYIEPQYVDIEIISMKENKEGKLFVEYKNGDNITISTFDNFFEYILKYDNKVVEPKNLNYGFDIAGKVE